MNVEKLVAYLATHVSKQNISRETTLIYQCSCRRFFFQILLLKTPNFGIFTIRMKREVQKCAVHLENRTLNVDFELPSEECLAASLQEGSVLGINA